MIVRVSMNIHANIFCRTNSEWRGWSSCNWALRPEGTVSTSRTVVAFEETTTTDLQETGQAFLPKGQEKLHYACLSTRHRGHGPQPDTSHQTDAACKNSALAPETAAPSEGFPWQLITGQMGVRAAVCGPGNLEQGRFSLKAVCCTQYYTLWWRKSAPV